MLGLWRDAMYDFLWNYFQQRQIDQTASQANRAASGVQDAARRVRDLESRLDALTLSCVTMWSLVQSRLGVTEEEFANRLREIDPRDGKLDGRIAPEVKARGECGRTMSSRHSRCMYCGSEALKRKPFEGAT